MGDVEFKDNSKKILADEKKAIKSILNLVGQHVEDEAKLNITKNKSVDTGLLRNSITHAVSGGSASISTYEADRPSKGSDEVSSGSYSGTIGTKGEKAVYVGTNVEYAPYVEMGTSKQSAKPYLRPAVEDNRQQIIDFIEKVLSE